MTASDERPEPRLLDEFRGRAPHDIRIIVVVDGVGAEALVVDEYELESNNAIVSMLYARVMGELNRHADREARIEEAIKVARAVTESTSGRHKVLELNDENLDTALHDPDSWVVIEVNEPKQWKGEDYNDWRYRIARWTRWAQTNEPSFTGATTAEIAKFHEWVTTRKDI